MKAMVFAAGLGTRLRPLTNDRPKALVEVGGKTMLEHVLLHLKDTGFTDVTVNVHHFGQMIIDYLAANNNFGLNIHISDERDLLLDTGGGLLKARDFLQGGEPFLATNADILTSLPFDQMWHSHSHSEALSTILVKSRKTQRYFLFDDDYRLKGWVNHANGATRPDQLDYKQGELNELAFGCAHVFSPKIFDLLDEFAAGKQVFSIVDFYMARCYDHLIKGYVHPADYSWFDVGKPETLEQAKQWIQSK